MNHTTKHRATWVNSKTQTKQRMETYIIFSFPLINLLLTLTVYTDYILYTERAASGSPSPTVSYPPWRVPSQAKNPGDSGATRRNMFPTFYM